jgi:hypothetical protein
MNKKLFFRSYIVEGKEVVEGGRREEKGGKGRKRE